MQYEFGRRRSLSNPDGCSDRVSDEPSESRRVPPGFGFAEPVSKIPVRFRMFRSAHGRFVYREVKQIRAKRTLRTRRSLISLTRRICSYCSRLCYFVQIKAGEPIVPRSAPLRGPPGSLKRNREPGGGPPGSSKRKREPSVQSSTTVWKSPAPSSPTARKSPNPSSSSTLRVSPATSSSTARKPSAPLSPTVPMASSSTVPTASAPTVPSNPRDLTLSDMLDDPWAPIGRYAVTDDMWHGSCFLYWFGSGASTSFSHTLALRLVEVDRLSLHGVGQKFLTMPAAGRVHGLQNLPEHGATNLKAFNLKDVEENIQTATTAPVSITLAGNKPQSDSPYRPWSIYDWMIASVAEAWMKARPWEYWRNVQVLAYRWAKGRIRDHERFLSLAAPVLVYEGFLAMHLYDQWRYDIDIERRSRSILHFRLSLLVSLHVVSCCVDQLLVLPCHADRDKAHVTRQWSTSPEARVRAFSKARLITFSPCKATIASEPCICRVFGKRSGLIMTEYDLRRSRSGPRSLILCLFR
jgi:hypothetical protein